MTATNLKAPGEGTASLLTPLRRWLQRIEPRDPSFARLMLRLIPGQCPFERDVVLFGRTVLHIPALCKLNPLYDDLTALRFRCLCYLDTPAPVGGKRNT